MQTAKAQGEQIDAEFLGPLRDSIEFVNNAKVLAQRMHEDGYIYLPGFFERDDVMAARRDIFNRLAGKQSSPSRHMLGTLRSITHCLLNGAFLLYQSGPHDEGADTPDRL